MAEDLENDIPQDFWDESWSCGTVFTPTPEMVRAMEDERFIGYTGDNSIRPFLVARLQTVFGGTVVFVKRATGWAGIAIASGHSPQGVFVAPGKGRAIVFTMHTVEGPGHEFQILYTTDGFDNAACSILDFPDEVPSPETYLLLLDFNAEANGEGLLVGSADIESENGASQTRWFRYRTRDGGVSWSGPEALLSLPERAGGVYVPLMAEQLIADLRTSLG